MLARHVEARGEGQRAADAMAHVRRHPLWMGWPAERSTGHWPTPSRRAEEDLPPDLLARLDVTTRAAARRANREPRHGLRCPEPTEFFAELGPALS